MSRVEVFLCGERFRRDDGVAAAAACLLPDDVLALASVHETDELPLETLLALPPEAGVVVVDAAAGIEPGRVRRLPLDRLAEIAGRTSGATHAMELSAVLALAAEMRGSPVRGTFVGIGAADLGFGEGLSPVVAAGLPGFAQAIASEIRRLAAGTAGTAGAADADDAG